MCRNLFVQGFARSKVRELKRGKFVVKQKCLYILILILSVNCMLYTFTFDHYFKSVSSTFSLL